MQNAQLKKRYISLIRTHLAKLGYPAQLKSDVSYYANIGDVQLRISDHIGFEDIQRVNIIVNSYTKDIIVIVNSQINVYHSLKEVKDFLTSFVYLHESKMTTIEGKDLKVSNLKSQLSETTAQLKSAYDRLIEAETKLRKAEEKLSEKTEDVSLPNYLKGLQPSKPYSKSGDLYLFNTSKLTARGMNRFTNAVTTCITVATTPKNIKLLSDWDVV